MLYKAEIRKYASQQMLRYFIPITIIATPLGQITGDRVSTDIVEAVGGVLVTFVAIFEIYQKRDFFASFFCRNFNKNKEKNVEKYPDELVIMETDGSGNGSEGEDSICVDQFSSLFDLDATVSENAKASNRPEHESEASLCIEGEDSIHVDQFSSLFDIDATVSENAKASNRPERESEASLCIEGEDSIHVDQLSSLFDTDATLNENAKASNRPERESEDSLCIDDFTSLFDLDATVSENLL
jgi:hypothetical protein